MSILKYILKPFVEFKEESPGELHKSQANTNEYPDGHSAADDEVHASTASSSAPYVSSPSVTTAKSQGGNAYLRHFEDLMEEANAKNPLFQGTDFKEFMDSKVDVEAIPDEGMRYKTAFNVLKRTGLTKEKLLTTGQAYIQIIDADLKGFVAAYEQEYRKNVEQKEELLQKKAAELQSLSEKISALNAEMKKMSEEIVKSKNKLNANKNTFFEAGEKIKKEIQTELQKIDQYF